MRDLAITSTRPGGGRIAVRDFGGTGPAVLLLHGVGGNLADLTTLGRHLAATYRVVSVDLPGHGHSDGSGWAWDRTLTDLAAVAADLGLGEPAVVGSSLGGIVATLWADRHPGCPGAISLDGNPTPSRPDQLDGLAPAAAASSLRRLRVFVDEMAETLAEPIDEDEISAARSGQRTMAEQFGDDASAWIEAFDRSLVRRGERTYLRPNPETTRAVRAAMSELDLQPAYAGTRCPLLLVLATTDLPEQEPFHDLYAAYRRHLERRLAAITNPDLHVVRLDGASHAMVAERPAEIAALIADFLTSARSPAVG
jgi:pimeloyl-ACP methyl ester carboxylesterase